MSNLLDIVLQQKHKLEVESGKTPTTLFISEVDFKELIKEFAVLQQDNVDQLETSFAGLKVKFQKEGSPRVK